MSWVCGPRAVERLGHSPTDQICEGQDLGLTAFLAFSGSDSRPRVIPRWSVVELRPASRGPVSPHRARVGMIGA
jgi:hypothetical protein